MFFIDVLVVLVLLYGFIKGFRSGFVISFLGLLAVVFGVIGGIKLVPFVSYQIGVWFNTVSVIIPFLAFILVFIGILIAVKFIGKLVTSLLDMLFLGFINKVTGALFGTLITLFLLSMLTWLFNQVGIISPEFKVHSYTYSKVMPIAPFIIDTFSFIIPGLKSWRVEAEKVFEVRDASDKVLETTIGVMLMAARPKPVDGYVR